MTYRRAFILVSIAILISLIIGCNPDPAKIASEIQLAVWVEDQLTKDSVNWYYFNGTQDEEYFIEWDDLYGGSGTYSLDVVVSVYREDLSTPYFEDADLGYGYEPDGDEDNTARIIIAEATERIYIKIAKYEGDGSGTYALRAYRDTERPVFDPPAGMYDTPQTVNITCNTPDAIIRYTTDGTNPSQTNGTIYDGQPIDVSEETNFNAIAYKDGNIDSSIVNSYYYIGDVPQKEWTIMVWMAAANDLEPFAMSDLNEMEYGLFLAETSDSAVMDKVNILVTIDRIEGFEPFSYDDGPDWTDARRYWMRPDSNGEYDNQNKLSSLKLGELGEISMGDPQNLKDFIEFTKTTFPANNFGLIIWNHGSGVKGGFSKDYTIKAIAYDYEEDGNDPMYVGEINDYLNDTHSVEFMGLDACLMGMAEVAYEFRPDVPAKFGTDYMTFSPQYEIGAGWDYEKVFQRFGGTGTDDEGDTYYDVSSMTAEQLAILSAKEYKDAYIPMPGNPNATNQTQTAIDVSMIEDVRAKMDLLAMELVSNQADIDALRTNSLPDDNQNPPQVDEGVVIPYRWNDNLYKNFDLYDFAREIERTTSPYSQAAKDAASNLKTSIENAILVSYGLDDEYKGWENDKNGLAYFFPEKVQDLEWYTSEDANALYSINYGKLDFLDGCDDDGVVENWKELIEYWYDNDNSLTPTEQW
jgi:clostripain